MKTAVLDAPTARISSSKPANGVLRGRIRYRQCAGWTEKPAPEIYTAALTRAGINPGDVANGKARWRKLKGIARIRLSSGRIRIAELHWYEAHGIGRKEIRWKRYLD